MPSRHGAVVFAPGTPPASGRHRGAGFYFWDATASGARVWMWAATYFLTIALSPPAHLTPRSLSLQPRATSTRMIGSFFSNLRDGIRKLQEIDYAGLEGLPGSFAREAGERALAGEVPVQSKDGKYDVATFAGGCFWGTELHFQRMPGVIATAVGYTQGEEDKPTYSDVCTGATGHTEGLQLIYDPKLVSYETLCRKLLSTINPTLRNRVGNDRGTQYRHGVYPHSDAQWQTAERVLKEAQAAYDRPIVTELKRATIFWPAENYHQRYLEKGGQSAAKDAAEKVRCYG